MKILIDMNLSPGWVDEFERHKLESVHWSTIGRFDAPDSDLIDWARAHNYLIFTHDLDFGTALALTKADSPSVIQIRTQNVTIQFLSKMLIPTLIEFTEVLEKGALLIIDEDKRRVRVLPL